MASFGPSTYSGSSVVNQEPHLTLMLPVMSIEGSHNWATDITTVAMYATHVLTKVQTNDRNC